MKGIKVILAVCLALLRIGDVWANESDDAVRAATRRGATNTVASTRQKTNTPDTSATIAASSRVANATTKKAQSLRERTTTPRATANVSTTSRTATRNISPRASVNTSSRATTTSRTATTSNTTRAATMPRAATRAPITSNRTTSTAQRASIARSAKDTETVNNLRDAVMNANAKECREIYYNCMDEFCANKDSQLKRCACSSRLHEFDSVKKQLENAEEKMLDFSQRLLTVSMDAKDAAALNVATEGELAFNQKDTSESKKILDEITKKLNTKFDDDSFGRNLTAISLSLNEDAAFDNVDSLMGASTTLKTGTALYGAALPVCREMASEICTPEQLSIAESGYQMMIEKDCNTVKKSYQSQTDNARAKVLENSALLDMSRLSTYQDKNSDDILTCKRKMLDMLSNTSVCGDNLTKCLDMTGQYIDPSTGEAFLTINLANLSSTSVALTNFLMLIGGSPMSIAGGIKTTTLFVLIIMLFKSAQPDGSINYKNRNISSKTINKAIKLLLSATALIATGSMLIVLFETGTFTFEQVFFETVSAISTSGLSLGITTLLSTASKLVLITLMFIGRVGMLTVPLLFKQNQTVGNEIEYPDSKIVVG